MCLCGNHALIEIYNKSEDSERRGEQEKTKTKCARTYSVQLKFLAFF